MPTRFTVSQLKTKGAGYTIVDTDLAVLTTGTNTFDLSSVRVSVKELGDYVTTELPMFNRPSNRCSVPAYLFRNS